MKSLYKWGAACILCGAMASFVAPVFAEEAAQEAAPVPAVAPAEESKSIGFLKSVEISGFVDTYYRYNYNTNLSNQNRGGTAAVANRGLGFSDIRAFDRENNSFTLDNVEISIFKASTEKDPIGFGFTTNYGEISQRLTPGSSFAGTPRTDGSSGSQSFTISQGFVTYKAPVGKGIDFKVGKFATWIGSEVWESIDNPNYSRSLLYTLAIPITNTGISASYPVTDKLTTGLFLVNGWDNFVDNNTGKTVGYQFAYKFSENTSLILNGIHGPEQAKTGTGLSILGTAGPDAGDNLRHVWDVIFAFKPLEKTTVNLNADFGTEANAAPPVPGAVPALGNGKWWGVSGIVSRDITDSVGVALRGEYFDDHDGARLGVHNLSLYEATFTTNIKIRQNLLLRPEVRYDKANKDIFGNSAAGGTNHSGNVTTAIAIAYMF